MHDVSDLRALLDELCLMPFVDLDFEPSSHLPVHTGFVVVNADVVGKLYMGLCTCQEAFGF